jgi:hypothetical protein
LNKLVSLSIKSGNLAIELLFELLILVLVMVIATARSLREKIEGIRSVVRDKEGAEIHSIYQRILGESPRKREIRDRQRLEYLRRISRANLVRKATMNPSGTGTLASSGSSEGLAGVTPLETVRATVYTTPLVHPFSSVL